MMKRPTLKAMMMLALPLAFAVPAFAAPPVDDVEPTEAEALEDDILMVINLPIAADEARTAGVEETELTEGLEVAEAAGISAGDMADVLDEESEQVKANGKRKAFGMWVKLQVADGVRGKDLAAKIKDRKEDLDAMSDEDEAAFKEKVAKIGELQRERRKQVNDMRKHLRDEGKQANLAGKDRYDAMMAKADDRHAAAKAQWKQFKQAAKADKRDEKLDKRDEKLDRRDEKLDERDARLDERDDKLDKRDDKLDKRGEKLDEKLDKLDEKRDKRDKRDEKQPANKAPNKPANQPANQPAKKGPQ